LKNRSSCRTSIPDSQCVAELFSRQGINPGRSLKKAKKNSGFPTNRLLFSKFGDRTLTIGSCSVGAFMARQAKDLEPKTKSIRSGSIANFTSTRSATQPGDRLRSVSRLNYEQAIDRVSRRALVNAELALRDSDEPMPLFLTRDASDDVVKAEEPWEPGRSRAKNWSAATKMTMIALVTLAIIVPLVFSTSPNTPLANATASEIVPAALSVKSTESAPLIAKRPEKSLLAVAEQEVSGTQPAVRGPKPGPTRDDIVAAYKSAVSIQVETPRTLAAVQSPSRVIDGGELANLVRRGQYLISVGDIASARLLLERAADAQEPSAAFALAGTYDPAVLGRSRAFGIAPDLAMARLWYEKALKLGSLEAQQRLDKLQK
jgi:hypothetical protein